MKRVYEARDGLEAHMVAGLMEQAGIMAQVRGDMLQGAVGELPAAGLASVWVADDDEARARAVVRDFEAEQPPNPEPGARQRLRESVRGEGAGDTGRAFRNGLLLGVVLGGLVMAWLLTL